MDESLIQFERREHIAGITIVEDVVARAAPMLKHWIGIEKEKALTGIMMEGWRKRTKRF